MTYDVSEYDKYLIRQHVLDLRIRIEVLDFNNNLIDRLEGGIIEGSFSIDAESDIRRTFSLSVIPAVQDDVKLDKDGIIWLDRKIVVYIGVKDQRTDEFKWFVQGQYVFTSASCTYDAITNTLNLSCSDLSSMFDGSRCGNLGYLNYIIPAYDEDPNTGQVIKYNTIREAMITIVKQLGWQWVNDYDIDEMGERKGMPYYAQGWDYMAYRESTKTPVQSGALQPIWNTVPFDQEFSGETTVLNIINTLRDLYESYETFFDIYGTYCCNLIPSGDDDPIMFDNDFFQRILISENTELDFTEVKNMCEVWGETFEEDFYVYDPSKISYTPASGGRASQYTITVDGYDSHGDVSGDGYVNGDVIAVKIPANNIYGCKLLINGNDRNPIYIYDENTEQYLSVDTLRQNGTYCFSIRKRYDSANRTMVTKAYYMGEWQPHAIAVLTDGTIGEQTQVTYYDAVTDTYKTITVNKFSKKFFEKVYNCNTVQLIVNPDSPFTIQRIGIIPFIKTDNNIKSDSTALETALQENYRHCRLTDNITIETKICPFADVNQKVAYRPHDSEEANEYLIKSVSHDLSSGKTTWTLMRYYRLYLITF